MARYDNVAANMSGKLYKVRRRGYVIVEEVKLLTKHFSVTKGENRRMLYNRKSSGLNTSL